MHEIHKYSVIIKREKSALMTRRRTNLLYYPSMQLQNMNFNNIHIYHHGLYNGSDLCQVMEQ